MNQLLSSPLLEIPTPSILPLALEHLHLVLAGDSTVCDQPLDSPYRGWGQCLPQSLGQHVRVTNLAKSGASTKTFIKEGLWDEVLNQKPDWVLIQMGHNDSHAPQNPESTQAEGEYAANLHCFIDDLRSIGAQPVLVTPVRRFRFNDEGHLIEPDSALAPYAKVVREIGFQLQVPFVDLFASSTRFFEGLGSEAANQLSPQPGEDFTHFNTAGAQAIAALVAEELLIIAPELGSSVYQSFQALTALHS